jgi:hypothetical protein
MNVSWHSVAMFAGMMKAHSHFHCLHVISQDFRPIAHTNLHEV